MVGDKPLFSRGQLSILMVVATLAIALLSSLDGKPGVPEVRRLDLAQVPVYWSRAHDDQPLLLVNLALPDIAEPMVVETVLQQLTARLGSDVESRRHPDRWELLLAAAPESLPPLLAALGQPLAPARWQQLGERYRAQRYLEGTLPGAALESGDSGFGSRAAAFHRHLLSRAQLSLSFTGVVLEEGPLPWRSGLDALPAGEPWPKSQGQNSVFEPSGEALVLALPGRGDADFPETALALQLLRPLVEAQGVEWRFAPGGASSRLRLIFTPTHRDPGDVMDRLDQALASLEAAQIEAARSQLLESLWERMADPRGYARQQGILAFYRLELDYWSRFVATMAALPAEAPVNRARGWLDPV